MRVCVTGASGFMGLLCLRTTSSRKSCSPRTYPGTAFFDPEFEKITPRGIPIQLWLGVLQVSLASLATWLSLRSNVGG